MSTDGLNPDEPVGEQQAASSEPAGPVVPPAIRARVAELVENFRINEAAYKNPAYNETQTRREFIDPFFKALGWDIDNEAGYAPAYKDVIHEDAIKVGGMTKAPDYCFRIGGQRKFFVEAKKPAVDMKNDPEPYYQLRRYAYSAKLPLSIVTDFEELAIVDCRAKPLPSDKASTGRIRYWRYDEYLDHLDELLDAFSPEGIKRGGLDRMATSAKAKRGTGEVDKEFLKEIESWRELLAKNIALRNPGLSQRELNEAVQVTIDRIIFLRICEDRGIEDYGNLQGMQNGVNVYARLLELFQTADERYNSGLFHFREERGNPNHPDELTLGLTIDDKPLKQILKGLYYPDSPYEFSVLPIDILGQVYEQFLGKVIRLTAGHQAKVEDKPEVKKAGGVYYTPTYIVDYIVKNTVGKLLGCHPEPVCHPERSEGSKDQAKPITPKEAAKLRILDPACGSGSFLIGAYEYLLDWHRDWYSENDAEKWATGKEPRLFAGKNGWQLTTAEKKRILLNNIYGVDIDPQAVEVTKLSLLLKVLEEESQETINSQLKFFHERALPDLSNNIKCGNSLIGTDFYEGQQMGLLDDEERYQINAFDWGNEFPEIFSGKNPGFDAVIGNPPYVRQEILGDRFKEYAKRQFDSYAGTADLYVYFIEKSHWLMKKEGLFGMICSNKFMRTNYGNALRTFLSTQTALRQIIDFGELPVFQKAATFPAVILTKNASQKEQKFVYAPLKALSFQSLAGEVKAVGNELDDRSLEGGNWTLVKSEELSIFGKMKKLSTTLGEYVHGDIYYGVKTGLNKAFVIDRETRDQLIEEDGRSKEIIKPFIMGDDIRKYRIDCRERYLIFTRRGIDIKEYPAVERYLSRYKEQLIPKPRGWKGTKWRGRKPGAYQWFEIQDTVDYFELFERPKIVYPDIAKESRVAFDPGGLYFGNTVYFISSEDLYLLGLLNSKLIFRYFGRNAAVLGDADRGGRLRWFSQDVVKIPIRSIDFSDPSDKSRHDQIVDLVNRMLDLNKQLQSAKTAHDKTTLQRQIDAADRQIDRLVYELYDLTAEEIKIVEEVSNV